MFLYNCTQLANLKNFFSAEDKFFTDIKIIAQKKDAVFIYNASNFYVKYTLKNILENNAEEEVIINKKMFFNLLSKLEKNFIEITPGFIKTKKCFLKIEQPEDYLTPPVFKPEKCFFINKNILTNVKHACAQEGQSVLRGVNISPAGGLATDGNRLCAKKNGNNAADNVENVTLPYFVAQILENLKEEKIKIETGGNRIKISAEDAEIVANKYTQDFPNCAQILKQSYAHKVNLNKKTFLEGANLLKILQPEKNICMLQIGAEGVFLKSKKEDFTFCLTNNAEGANPCKIGFYLLYILDMLNNAETESIEMLYNNNYSASVFKTGESKKDLIMPIAL